MSKGNKNGFEQSNHDFNDPAVANFYHQPVIAQSVDDYSKKLEGKYPVPNTFSDPLTLNTLLL